MTEFTNFEQLNDEATYIEIVTTHFLNAFNDITAYGDCHPTIDTDRLKYGHGEYLQSISKFTVLLASKNPDQYKRAGALLHSLYQAKPVTAIQVSQDRIDALEMNQLQGISYDDAQHRLKLIEIYKEYANEIMSFDLAFRCCDLYEKGESEYGFDFLINMAYYLKENTALSTASLAMIFKAFMA